MKYLFLSVSFQVFLFCFVSGVHVYVTTHGLFKETKSSNPFLMIRNNGWNVTITVDGLYQFPDIPLGYEYNIIVDETYSNIDPGFECTAVANNGNASLPFVNVIFICDWTSKFHFFLTVFFFNPKTKYFVFNFIF